MKSLILSLFMILSFSLQAQSKYSGGTGDGFSSSSASWSAPLPVKLISFRAQASAPGVELTWITAMEHQSESFILLKSRDGKEWTHLATVQAFGESLMPVKYSYHDSNCLEGKWLFRLIENDLTGHSALLSTTSIELNPLPISVIAFPNPAHTEFQLQCQGCDGTEWFDIELYDLQGHLVISEKVPSTALINTMQLPEGYYILRINRQYSSRLVVQH